MLVEESDPRRTPEGRLRVSRTLFVLGFFMLPMVWLLNFVYMRKAIQHPNTNPTVKRCTFLE
jgi:Presenilin enhancer-2 subunit of gamma secretase